MEEKKLVKVYVTKYALTRGILEYDAEIDSLNGEVFARCLIGKSWQKQTFWDKDFYLLMEDAVANAEYRKQKKINSLNRQVTKLFNTQF